MVPVWCQAELSIAYSARMFKEYWRVAGIGCLLGMGLSTIWGPACS